MIDRDSQLELLLDLEARHDDLLLRLAELDQRVEKTLAECLVLRQPVVLNENTVGPIQEVNSV
ncbi:MAG TPA: hypothetical protein VIH42_01605 [Thermoguttaceae bacterium]